MEKLLPMDKMTDIRLVELIQQNNELAFSHLFNRYWEELLDAAIKIIKDTDIAQDCLQEVFADFWNKRFEQIIHNPRSYLHQSIRYKVIDQIRKRKVSLYTLDHTEQLIGAESPEEQIEYQELYKLLDTSIKELPDQCERVFRMSRFDQMSNREIADQLDLSVRTVENHIARALRLLRAKLGSAATLLFFTLPLLS